MSSNFARNFAMSARKGQKKNFATKSISMEDYSITIKVISISKFIVYLAQALGRSNSKIRVERFNLLGQIFNDKVS